jgi:diguanylate cyclase (GGDEF)-like protein
VDFSKSLLHSRLVDILYQSTKLAVLGNALVGLCVSYYYWDFLDPTVIVPWLFLVLIVSFLRVYVAFQYQYRRDRYPKLTTHHWSWLFIVGSGLSALCWSVALIYLLYSLAFADVVFFYLTILALVSASLGMTSSSSCAFSVYAGVALLPASILSVFHFDLPFLGFLTACYYLVTLIVSLKSHKVIKQSIIHQLTNDRLMMALQHEKDQVLRLNTKLKKDLKAGKRTAETLLAQKHEAEELAEKMYELSAIDSLTGIANRRVFDDILIQEWARARRINAPLALIVADIDHFKLLNDHYGHHYGDECLQQVATILKQQLKRPSDLVARFGGEEFVIVLPNTGLESAEMLAKQMRYSVEAAAMPHEFSPVASVVTISLGVASMIPNNSLSGYSLFEAADKALYMAKRQGRNCTIAADSLRSS